MTNEMTVLITCSYEELNQKLTELNFKIIEQYLVKDIYMINKNIDINLLTPTLVLQNCILVRNIDNKIKKLVYKKKNIASNGDIINQSKTECPITDITLAVNFMKSIDYKKLMLITDQCIIYKKENYELCVQVVNNKYVFIEIEENFNNKSIDEIISSFKKLNLPYDDVSYYAKKAEIILKEKLGE